MPEDSAYRFHRF